MNQYVVLRGRRGGGVSVKLRIETLNWPAVRERLRHRTGGREGEELEVRGSVREEIKKKTK